VKAWVYTRYGPPEVVRLEEVAKPDPLPNELLIKVRATTVNRTDCGVRQADPVIARLFTGLIRPRHTILAVCGTENMELVRSLGADRVIDYRREDFTKEGRRYDVVFDAVGKSSFRRCRRLLERHGRFLFTTSGSCGTPRCSCC
jgi:NADPH:quinone reductase-like Zn-dependent oxidoreductase